MLYHTDLSFRVFHRVTWHCISLSGTSTVPFSYLVPNICTYTAFLFHAACCTHETYPNQRTLRQARIIAVLFTFHGFSSCQPSAGCIQTPALGVYAVRYAARRAFIGPTPPMAGPSCCLAHASAFLPPRSIIRAYPRTPPAVFSPTSAWARCYISFLTHRAHL